MTGSVHESGCFVFVTHGRGHDSMSHLPQPPKSLVVSMTCEHTGALDTLRGHNYGARDFEGPPQQGSPETLGEAE